MDAHWGSIREDSLYYHFGIRGPIRFLPEVRDKQLRFTSQEFREIFPDLRYAGDIYLLEITRDEIKLFNFYTATLDAFYSNGLTLTPRKLQDADGNYYFAIRKSCFARPPTEYRILQ